MIAWTVTDAERAAFARFSGDRNPIHHDSVGARRLHGGRLQVHGAHLLLSVVEQAIGAGHLTSAPAALTVTFRHGVEPDVPLTTSFELSSDSLRAQVTADVWPAVDIEIHPGHLDAASILDTRPLVRGTDQPTEHDLGELDGFSGSVELRTGPDGEVAFPLVDTLLGRLRVAEIARISYVVGMRAPGLYSMSSKYEIEFAALTVPPEAAGLNYRVEAVDHRMRRVRLSLSGPTMSATVTAFSPPAPVDQHEVLAEGERPIVNEFAAWRVLVVGGSRGLGAAAVLLLTAGGADVRFTYRDGDADAETVASCTGATALHFDAEGAVRLADSLTGWQPTHLCWFASPARSGGVAGVFSERLTEQLSTVMVDAVEHQVAGLTAPPLKGVLWPSSELIEHPGRGNEELVAVLEAGEASCRRLAETHPGLTVHVPRWPRLSTDQTASLLPVEYADTASVMLAALRALPN